MSWSRTCAFVARRADHAGRLNFPWLLVSVLAGIELVGATPITADWPRQDTNVASGVLVASRFLQDHAARSLTASSDPLSTWVAVLLPAPSRWLAIALVPVLIVVMLSVLRERRATTISARALRLAAAGVAYLVVVLYLRHIMVSLLDPLVAGLVSVHYVVLILIATGIVVLVRSTLGRPNPAPGAAGRGLPIRLRKGLAVVLTTALGVVLVGLLPLPA